MEKQDVFLGHPKTSEPAKTDLGVLPIALRRQSVEVPFGGTSGSGSREGVPLLANSKEMPHSRGAKFLC